MIQTTHKEPKIALCRRCGGRGYVQGDWEPIECPQCNGTGRVTVSGEMTLDIRPYKPRKIEDKK